MTKLPTLCDVAHLQARPMPSTSIVTWSRDELLISVSGFSQGILDFLKIFVREVPEPL